MIWQCRNHRFAFPRLPLVMGIVNVTPDSFSDGGLFQQTEAAVAHGLCLADAGADILDVGGESSRPGARPVPAEEELARVLPVVEALAARGTVAVSVDTTKADVARRCLAAGASIVNDITALTGDPEMGRVVASFGAGVVLMHMQGTPENMQDDPLYDDVVTEVADYLEVRLEQVAEQGISAECIAIDPGIGFGKTVAHNLELLRNLERFGGLGRPLCLGVSRKGFVGRVLGRPLNERLPGSLACAAYALGRGAAQILRVHDVAATRDLVRMFEAIENPSPFVR